MFYCMLVYVWVTKAYKTPRWVTTMASTWISLMVTMAEEIIGEAAQVIVVSLVQAWRWQFQLLNIKIKTLLEIIIYIQTCWTRIKEEKVPCIHNFLWWYRYYACGSKILCHQLKPEYRKLNESVKSRSAQLN